MAMRFTWVVWRSCLMIFLEFVCWIIRRPIAQQFTGDLQRLLRQRGIKPDAFSAGDIFHLSGDVPAQILFPPRIFSSLIADDEAYVIRVLVEPATSILFMSDSGIQTEEALLASDSTLAATSSSKDSIIPDSLALTPSLLLHARV